MRKLAEKNLNWTIFFLVLTIILILFFLCWGFMITGNIDLSKNMVINWAFASALYFYLLSRIEANK